MSSNAEEIVTPETIIETVVEVPAPVVPVELLFEYQPTDGDGRPLGGKQVIKYTDPAELPFKLVEQNTLLLRKLREETRKNRLGISEQDTIAEDAPRFQQPVEFKPRELSNEDRAQLSRDILDPENFDKAVATVFEASTGISAADLRSTLTTLQMDALNSKAQREVDKFITRNPEYIKCPENSEAITNWMSRYDLAPVAENFQKGYETLKAAGVLVTSLDIIPQSTYTPPVAAPVVEPIVEEEIPAREEIPVENQVVPVTPPVEEKPVVSRVPIALNRTNSSDGGGAPRSVADEIVYEFIQKDGQGRQVGDKRIFKGQAAINAMPSEEYKRRLLHEKGFAAKVEKLNQEAVKRHAR